MKLLDKSFFSESSPKLECWQTHFGNFREISEITENLDRQVRIGQLEIPKNKIYLLKLRRFSYDILFTEPPQPEFVDLVKKILEIIDNFHSQKFYGWILKATKETALKKDLKVLDELSKLSEKLAAIEKFRLPYFEGILKNQEDVYRFANYISREPLGWSLAENLARWIRDPEIKGFKNKKWLSEYEEIKYLKVIRGMIRDPETKLMIWEEPGIGRKPRLIYSLKKGKELLLASIDEKGFVENCWVADEYFLPKRRELVDAFYEI